MRRRGMISCRPSLPLRPLSTSAAWRRKENLWPLTNRHSRWSCDRHSGSNPRTPCLSVDFSPFEKSRDRAFVVPKLRQLAGRILWFVRRRLRCSEEHKLEALWNRTSSENTAASACPEGHSVEEQLRSNS